MSDPLIPIGAQERAEARLAKVLFALPKRVQRKMAGPPVVVDGNVLDLDTQLLLKMVSRAPEPPIDPDAGVERNRESLRSSARTVGGRPAEMAQVIATKVAGAAGELDARLYVPVEAYRDPEPSALIVFFHGGGWVVGDLDTHDAPCRLLAQSSGARVLSVAYRLAPEHPFPAGHDDCFAAFRDAHARAAELHVDPARIAVAGDSAGGHLSAVVCQDCARDGGPSPAFQLLIYPGTDFRTTRPSRTKFAEGYILTQDAIDWFATQFAGPEDARDVDDPRLSPILGELEGLPPAMVVTGGFDPLRDEGEAYADALIAAGVPVVKRRYAGYIHGFINILGLRSGHREAVAEMGGVVRSRLAPVEARVQAR